MDKKIVTVRFRTEPWTKALAQGRAEEEGVTLSAVMNELLWAYSEGLVHLVRLERRVREEGE